MNWSVHDRPQNILARYLITFQPHYSDTLINVLSDSLKWQNICSLYKIWDTIYECNARQALPLLITYKYLHHRKFIIIIFYKQCTNVKLNKDFPLQRLHIFIFYMTEQGTTIKPVCSVPGASGLPFKILMHCTDIKVITQHCGRFSLWINRSDKMFH